MRLIFPVFLVVILFGSSFAQKKMTDAEFAGLRGKVKSVVENAEFNVPNQAGSLEKKNEKVQEWQYDNHQALTTDINWGAGDKENYSLIDGYKTYKYESFDVPGVYKGPVAAAFGRGDLNKNPPDPRFSVKFEYKYDGKGRITEEIRYMSNGSLLMRFVHQYDSRGNNIETKSYFNDIVRRIDRNYFDEKGQLFLYTDEYPGDRGTTNRVIRRYSDYRFDSKGNWIERVETTVNTNDESLYETVIRRFRTIVYY